MVLSDMYGLVGGFLRSGCGALWCGVVLLVVGGYVCVVGRADGVFLRRELIWILRQYLEYRGPFFVHTDL